MAAAGPGAVIDGVGTTRLPAAGAPPVGRRGDDRRARLAGRPPSSFPGSGATPRPRSLAQADDADVPAIEVNVRRVVERVTGERLSERAAEAAWCRSGGRSAGATGCSRSWTSARCCAGRATRGARSARCAAGARRGDRSPARRGPRQAPFAGSFRNDGALVMARLRAGPAPVAELDADALASLVADGLAVVATRGRACRRADRTRLAPARRADRREEVARAGRGRPR